MVIYCICECCGKQILPGQPVVMVMTGIYDPCASAETVFFVNRNSCPDYFHMGCDVAVRKPVEEGSSFSADSKILSALVDGNNTRDD